MNSMIPAAALAAAMPTPDAFPTIRSAAEELLGPVSRGETISTDLLRIAMTTAFGGSDAEGLWDWKTAYDVCEIVQILFLRKFGSAIRARAASPAAELAMYTRIASLFPTHTRRSEESQALQQFSTPLPLAFVAAQAAAITPTDLVLEPSAGTGLFAIFAELAGAGCALNELADNRIALLRGLFSTASVTQHDAAHIHDFLDASVQPSVVLMNPPFSAAAHVDGRVADAAMRHIASALARLADGGRLVAITGASLAPDSLAWRDAFVRLQERARIVFSAAIDGRVYARHGTTTETRLTVIDKIPAADPHSFPASPGMASDAATLLSWIADLPPRAPIAVPQHVVLPVRQQRNVGPAPPAIAASAIAVPKSPASNSLTRTVEWTAADHGHLGESIYESYALQSVRIPGAPPHPTKLVQSAAMASVAPPKPAYRPRLPSIVTERPALRCPARKRRSMRVKHMPRFSRVRGRVDDTFDVVSAAPDDAEASVRFRRGWMLGDGTGAGKGRQVAGILLDNWCQGRPGRCGSPSPTS